MLPWCVNVKGGDYFYVSAALEKNCLCCYTPTKYLNRYHAKKNTLLPIIKKKFFGAFYRVYFEGKPYLSALPSPLSGRSEVACKRTQKHALC